jgi:hypothetical protein
MIKHKNISNPLLIFLKHSAMLSSVKSILLMTFLALVALPAFADGENWTTTDGTTYENVRVIRVEDDAITIIYKNGGALVPLFKLPPALQRKFDYDPVKAKLAAEARIKEDKENDAALQKEIAAGEEKKRQDQIKYAAQLGQTNTAAH